MKFWSPVEASPSFLHHLHGLPDLEAPSTSYPAELRSAKILLGEAPQPWQSILTVGPRNLEWLNQLNAQRGPEEQIQLSNPKSSKGIPMEEPLRYNDALLNERWLQIAQTMPETLKEVLLGAGPLPAQLPVDLEVYKLWARKVDVLYSNSLRWNSNKKNIPYYRSQKIFDFRGLHFLEKMGDEQLKAELNNFRTLPEERQKQLKSWVWDVCFNATKWDPTCDNLLDKAIRNDSLFAMYKKYQLQAEKNYDAFFQVMVPRKDIRAEAESLSMGFKPSDNQAINLFVKNNVEDEWKWTPAGLKLNLDPSASANIRFVPGTVAYVEEVGGNTITMDSQVSIDSWDSQWTIRHEFGHVLGFPDCYVEFWDEGEHAFVSYQFDLSNLMCSRAGRFNERNKAELFKAYMTPKLQSPHPYVR